MSELIRSRFSKPETTKKIDPKSVTVRSVLASVVAVILASVQPFFPELAMLIFTILPAWLQIFVSLDMLVEWITYLFEAIAVFSGLTAGKQGYVAIKKKVIQKATADAVETDQEQEQDG